MRSSILRGALLAALLVTGCSPAASPTPPPDESFVLRLWTTQAIPPKDAFLIGSTLVIADGVLYVPGAVPAIFPGPLLTPWGQRPIGSNGIAKIVAQAQEAGLLGPLSDFTGESAPGAPTGHILIGPASRPSELIGDPNAVMMCITTPCVPPPGTPNAFAGFWQWVQSAPYDVLADDLGPETLEPPTRIALLVGEPPSDPTMPGGRVDWPLGTWAETGAPFGGDATSRCVTLEGDQLAAVLPALQQANQLSVFVDGAGQERGLTARVLLPPDEDPCA